MNSSQDDRTDHDGERLVYEMQNFLRVSVPVPSNQIQQPPIIELSISRFEKDFDKGECIGQGGFGKVYECVSRVDRQNYAIKEVKLERDDTEELEKQMMECRNHAQFVHPNIVRYYDAWLESDNSSIFITHVLYIKMELCNSTLELYLQKRMNAHALPDCEPDTPKRRHFKIRVMTSLLSAVDFLHKNGVIHRDIKPNNIFIRYKKTFGPSSILLGDFGRARKFQGSTLVENASGGGDSASSGMSSNVGTFLYSAPELSTNDYTQSVDIYSIGIVMYEVFSRVGSKNERNVMLNELRDQGEPSVECIPEFSIWAPVIRSMVSMLAEKRPNATTLLEQCKIIRRNEQRRSLVADDSHRRIAFPYSVNMRDIGNQSEYDNNGGTEVLENQTRITPESLLSAMHESILSSALSPYRID